MKDPRFAEQLSIYVDVVRAGSFSGAARRRGVTPSAIVRQIDALEHGLGVSLLVRSTRALSMTDAGERLFQRAQRLLDELIDTHAEIAAFEGTVTGVLRLACLPTFGKRYVIQTLDVMMREHPCLAVELDLTERLGDPVLERMDAMIRIGDLADSTLIATRLASQKRFLVASPQYLEHHGTPLDRSALTTHRLIDKLYGADLLGWRDVLGSAVSSVPGQSAVFRCDDFEAIRCAAIAGVGIAFLADWVVGPDIKAGTLVRLRLEDETWNRQETGIYLLRTLPQPSAKLQVFSSILCKTIGSPPIWAS